MGKRRDWPQRYEIRMQPRTGDVVFMSVATWMSAEKAVAMAAQRYAERFPDNPVFDVEVVDLGPAAGNNAGVPKPARADLIDRWEF
ncbi:MAG: hypothetical protein ACRDKW_16070 [Actinomycetota bacterium]